MGTEKKCYRGISYGRVSTMNQVLDAAGSIREDASPAAQKIRCHEHAKFLSQKSGVEYQITQHISDEGFSAKNVRRPGYQQMWRFIESGSLDFVIASELSRLSRSVTDFLDLVSHCQRHDVDLIIIGLDLDTSTPFGRVIVVILVALAQFEREMTSVRVKENALTRLLKDGKINGSGEILGLDRDPKSAGHFIPNPEELKQVEILMHAFLMSPGKAKVLQEARKVGIKSKQGSEMNMNALTGILENAKWRYRGLWYANKENKEKDQDILPETKRYQTVALPHGALLDLELLDKVCAKLNVQYSESNPRTGADSHIYLLSGILVHESGGKFTGEYAKGGQYRYYHNKKQRMRLQCDQIDDLVRNTVKEYFVSSQESRQIVRRGFNQLQSMLPGIDEKVGSLEWELGQVKKREREISKAFTAEKLSDPVYSGWLKEQINELSKEKIRLEREIEGLVQRKADFFSDSRIKALEDGIKSYIEEGFDGIPRQAQRSIIERIIPSVVIKSTNQIEIKVAIPYQNLVTNEEKSSTKVKDGGTTVL